MTPDQIALFLPAAALVAASPGANNLLSLTHGIRAGFGRTVASLGGRFAAFTLLIMAVAVGLGALLETSALAFAIVKWAGVAYLAWLGIRMWRSRELDLGSGGDQEEADVLALARREFVVALTNPKAALLFTAFLPQFVTPGTPFAPQLALLGALYVATEFVAACGYALAGASIRRVEITPARAVAINRTTGGMMLGAAAFLATTRRSA
jgi:threonine/homoserine/homoserine lactone efflux protein